MEITPEMIAVIGCGLYGIASELIGMNPKWKSNSVVQLVMGLIGRLVR